MRLITAHKIMISSAILFGGFFAGWSANNYAAGDDSTALSLSILSSAATVGLVFYFRSFLRKNRK